MALVAYSQPNKTLKFLVQKYICLEPGPFRARSLNFLVQNVGPFTTPTSVTSNGSCIVRHKSYVAWMIDALLFFLENLLIHIRRGKCWVLHKLCYIKRRNTANLIPTKTPHWIMVRHRTAWAVPSLWSPQKHLQAHKPNDAWRWRS